LIYYDILCINFLIIPDCPIDETTAAACLVRFVIRQLMAVVKSILVKDQKEQVAYVSW